MSSAVCLSGDVWPFLDDAGVDLLSEYYERDDSLSGYRYSGAAFDSFGRDSEDPDRFGPADLVALSFLAVPVRGHAALAILDKQADDLHDLLRRIPAEVDLWQADESIVGPGSVAADLWNRLDELPDFGWVSVNKLLARKRPRLLPVYDSVLKHALQRDENALWLPLRQELQDESLRQRLAEMRASAGLPDALSLLRILDVAVWMRNGPNATNPLPWSPCHNR